MNEGNAKIQGKPRPDRINITANWYRRGNKRKF
jgi:hypothetical protein